MDYQGLCSLVNTNIVLGHTHKCIVFTFLPLLKLALTSLFIFIFIFYQLTIDSTGLIRKHFNVKTTSLYFNPPNQEVYVFLVTDIIFVLDFPKKPKKYKIFMHENRCDQIVNILLMSYTDIVFFASGNINCSLNLESNKSKMKYFNFHSFISYASTYLHTLMRY